MFFFYLCDIYFAHFTEEEDKYNQDTYDKEEFEETGIKWILTTIIGVKNKILVFPFSLVTSWTLIYHMRLHCIRNCYPVRFAFPQLYLQNICFFRMFVNVYATIMSTLL